MALLLAEIPYQCNLARDALDLAIAIDTILGMHALVQQPNRHILKVIEVQAPNDISSRS